MVDRINLLLKAKNITSRQFAEEIGIQPSGMSHILSGRNNPSLDFVMKVVRRWPEININWLMFGKGEMFTNVVANVPSPAPVPSAQSATVRQPVSEPDLFSSFETVQVPAPAPTPAVVQTPVQSSAAEISAKQEPQEVSIPKSEPVPAPESAPEPIPQSASKPQPDSASLSASKAVAEAPVEYVAPKHDENSVKEIQLHAAPVQPILPKHKKIIKMVVLYDDHTFAEYYPE